MGNLLVETACGGMVTLAVLLLHVGGLSNVRTRVVGISHCGGGSLIARAWAYVISFPGNNPTASLPHTKAIVSTPVSWLFLEKAFLGMSAWLASCLMCS